MHTDFPDLLSDESKESANILGLGPQAQKYQTGGSVTGGATGPVAGKTGAPPQTPPPPTSLLKDGVNTTFKNGQVWTLQNGKAIQVQ